MSLGWRIGTLSPFFMRIPVLHSRTGPVVADVAPCDTKREQSENRFPIRERSFTAGTSESKQLYFIRGAGD